MISTSGADPDSLTKTRTQVKLKTTQGSRRPIKVPQLLPTQKALVSMHQPPLLSPRCRTVSIWLSKFLTLFIADKPKVSEEEL